MTALDRLRKLARLMIDSRWLDCYEKPSCGACTAALGERILRLAMEIEDEWKGAQNDDLPNHQNHES